MMRAILWAVSVIACGVPTRARLRRKKLSERRVAAVERLGCHAQRLRRAVDAGPGVRTDHLAAGDLGLRTEVQPGREL